MFFDNFSTPEEMVSDSFQAFLVEDALFTEDEEYPILPQTMIAKSYPKKIMPFNKAINYSGDLSDTFVCFYAPDESFERVRRNPRKYISFFKRTAGIIGFDYSIHSDMPIIKQKSQINDNLSLTYFFGKHEIPIIPNIRCGNNELLPEFLSAIPKNSAIAVGTHGFIKTKQEKYEWYCFLENIIQALNPSTIIVYGHLTGSIFDDLKARVNFIFYDSWINTRFKEVKRNGN